MARKKRLLVAQGGGPTAVINASLAGLLAEARTEAVETRIAVGGIEGVMAERFHDVSELSNDDLAALKQTPGAGAGSGRYRVKPSDHQRIAEILDRNQVDYFFYIGGNDSMDTCLNVARVAKTTRVVGIPKTVDNDLEETDHCPGYGSAARYTAVTVRELGLDVRSLPIHAVIIELMGRHAGWLTAAAALARDENLLAPHLIYLPERPLVRERFIDDVREAQRRSGTGIVVAVSEGLCDENGDPIATSGMSDGFGHAILGGTGQALSELLVAAGIPSRSEKPGLIARASRTLASEVDREEAYECGRRSFEAAAEGAAGVMIGMERVCGEPYEIDYRSVDLERVANRERMVPAGMISETGCDVTTDFLDYAMPLIGERIPTYFTIPYDGVGGTDV